MAVKKSPKKGKKRTPAKKNALKAKAKKPKTAGKRAKKKAQMKKVVEKVVKVDKKLVEWRKSLMAPAERGMIEFFLYPVAKNRMDREAAKKVMVESYVHGDEVVKQFILFLAHEQLSRAAGLKAMHNFAHYRKMLPKDAGGDTIRKAVYRSIFNYTTSIEGLVGLLGFLGELGDTGAAKLLSYHLSYYSSMDSPALQVLRNATLDALMHCESPYAIDALLAYAKYGERNDRALYAIRGWEKKLPKSGLSAEEKKFYAKQIAELFVGGREKHEYYR